MKIILLVFVLLILSCDSAVKKEVPHAVYNPSRTYVVTKVGENYLVRGNEPLNNDWTFAYEALNKKLKTLIDDTFDLKSYKLIDISIIDNNPASERGDLKGEFTAYNVAAEFDSAYPFPASWPPYFRGADITKQWGTVVAGNKGSIIWYPVEGCSDSANCEQVESPQFNFIGMVDYIHDLLKNESKAVIYQHCEHGHDRTSALSAAYMMKYMGRSLDSVLTMAPPDGAKAFSHPWEINYEQLVRYYARKYVSSK